MFNRTLHGATLTRGTRFHMLLCLLVILMPLMPLAAPTPAHAAGLPFEDGQNVGSSSNGYSVAWGDMDRDGDLDLVLGNDGIASQLFRNEQGTLKLDPTWTPAAASTRSVALGDMDGDGDLDLALGNFNQRSQLYRNDNGALRLDPTWKPDAAQTYSVVWGDLEGDGDLDLVLGNSGTSSRLYRNHNGTLELDPAWTPVAGFVRSVAWGDLEGDGDLDLALGGLSGYSQFYRNNNGALMLDPTWPVNGGILSMAWGDIDGDGDLDLAVGRIMQNPQLYRNQDGILQLEPTPISNALFTNSLAWGDADSDGDLDLMLGNSVTPSELYLNQGRALESKPAWTFEAAPSYSVAWGDLEGDGDLDLVLGNSGEPSRLYRNHASVLALASTWQTRADISPAWGDVDGDGDLDLALGSLVQGNQLYRNDNGALTLDPTWTPGPAKTYRVAWGDVDGDGDLDLAAGNSGTPSQLYRNRDGVLELAPTWAPAPADTRSLAWGDVDGDGDLDLVVGNANASNRLYRNRDGVLELDPTWTPPPAATTAVAWGDLEGDGDLDLVVANMSRNVPSQLYRNRNGVLELDPAWKPGPALSSSVAWGDLEGDGDLDLVVGNYGNNQIYRNHDGVLEQDSTWTPASAYTDDVTLGDLEGDGDLDLVVGGYSFTTSSPFNRLYLNNDGVLTLDSSWTPAMRSGADVALGDVEGDGDLDLAAAEPGILHLFRYRRSNESRPPVSPRIRLISPDTVPPLRGANGYANTPILAGQLITLTYTLTHPDSQPASRIIAQFSLNGGGHWQTAVSAGTNTTNLSSSPAGITHTYTWDTFASGVFGQSDNVIVRLVTVPDVPLRPNQVPGPYLYGGNSSATLNFRLRGTQVRVQHAGGTPVAGALVYRLPAGQVSGARVFMDGSTGSPFETNDLGFLSGQNPIKAGDQLVALLPISDTGVYSYTRYYTSAAPTPTGLDAFTVTQLGIQTLSVSPANPLLLFHLDIALEWDARSDEQFMSQLRANIQRVSELLYDWSDGQVALGTITIYHDKEHWDDADIRIYATNRLRPSATQGGITPGDRTDPLTSLTYERGQVRIGATWNRSGEAGQLLGEDWPRALAHELGHFALYLDDNYLGLDDNGRLITVEGCPGAMSDPYRNDYSEFHPTVGWLPACKDTLSNHNTGRSDWDTIKAFYDQAASGFMLNQPAARNANPGPTVLPLAVTQIREIEPAASNTPLNMQIFPLSGADNARYESSPGARTFLFSRDGSRITDLGQPARGQVIARGFRPNDRLCVFDTGAAYLGCTQIRQDAIGLTMSSIPGWHPEVLITPVTSNTLTISVPKDGTGEPTPRALMARLFPADSAQPPVTTTLELQNEQYQGTLILREPALEGYIQVWVPGETDPHREIVTDYTLGGNPAPSDRPPRRSRRKSPAASTDGQVILFADDLNFQSGQFYSIQTATSLPKPPAWADPIGQGYRLLASQGAPALSQTSITIAYANDEVPVRAKRGIAIYFHPEGGTEWQKLATAIDANHNTAMAQVAGPGLYTLMAGIDLRLGKAGWNHLYDYPGATQPVTATLASIDGKYTTVYGYDETDADDPWKVYDIAVPAWVNDLDKMEYGQTYWIRTTEAVSVSLRPENSLSQANQLQDNGSVNAPPATYYGILQPSMGFVPTPDMPVIARVNDKVCGRATTKMEGEQVVFAVNVHAVGTGDTADCGTRGQPIDLEVGGYILPLVLLWNNDRPQEVIPLRWVLSLPFITR